MLWDFYDPRTRYDHDPGDYFSFYKDNVDLSLSEIWRVIGDTENNEMNNMKDVYDAFIARANDNVHPLRNEDGTPVTTSDVQEIFIAHGFFDDFYGNHRVMNADGSNPSRLTVGGLQAGEYYFVQVVPAFDVGPTGAQEITVGFTQQGAGE